MSRCLCCFLRFPEPVYLRLRMCFSDVLHGQGSMKKATRIYVRALAYNAVSIWNLSGLVPDLSRLYGTGLKKILVLSAFTRCRTRRSAHEQKWSKLESQLQVDQVQNEIGSNCLHEFGTFLSGTGRVLICFQDRSRVSSDRGGLVYTQIRCLSTGSKWIRCCVNGA